MAAIEVGIFQPPKIQKNPIMMFVDWAIKFRTWSKYTHTAIMLGNGMLISATWPHIKTEFVYDYPKGTKIEIYEVECTEEQRDGVIKWFKDREGKAKYDLKGLLGFVLRKHIEDRKKYFCSEAVVLALYKNGIYPFAPDRCPPWKVSPGVLRYSPILKYKTTWTI